MMIYRKHPLTAGRIVDGLAFVVTADDNKLHTLNETGTELWALAQEGFTVEQAAEMLVEKFAVDLAVATRDVLESLDIFVEQGLLEAEPG